MYCYNPAWVKNGGLIPWTAAAICEMSKTSWKMGKHRPLKGPVIPSGSMVEYRPISAKDHSRLQFGKHLFPGMFFGCALYAGGIWNGDVLVADIGRAGKFGRVRNPRRLRRKLKKTPRVVTHLIFPIADGTVKLSGRDHGIRKSTFMRDHPVRGEEPVVIFGEVRTGLCQWTKWWMTEARNDFWSIEGRFQLSSSQRTSSSALRAEGRIIPSTIAIHWRGQDNTYHLGCVAGKPHRWLLEHWCESKFIGNMDQFSRSSEY